MYYRKRETITLPVTIIFIYSSNVDVYYYIVNDIEMKLNIPLAILVIVCIIINKRILFYRK